MKKKRKRKNKKANKSIYYSVEKIIKHKIKDDKLLFLIKWENYPDDDNSWIYIDQFNETTLLDEYLLEHNLSYEK